MSDLYQAPKPRILVVDDHREVLIKYRWALGPHYDLETATDGVMALKQMGAAALEGRLHEAVVSDFDMFEGMGDDLLRHLRGHGNPDALAEKYFNGDRRPIDAVHRFYHRDLGNAPIFMVSATPNRLLFEDLGATGILLKDQPVDGHIFRAPCGDAVLRMVSAHVPYHTQPITVVPTSHGYLTAGRKHESGLLEIPPVGAERPYDRR